MSSPPGGSPSSSSSDSTSWTDALIAVVAVVVFGIVIIVVVLAIIKCIKSRRSAARPPPQVTSNDTSSLTSVVLSSDRRIELEPIEEFLNNILKEKPARFNSEQLREFTKDYSQKLGSGGFGVVYKGWFPNGAQVAVKVLHEATDKEADEQFMAEVGTIGRTYHLNLVKLYGFCFDASVKALIYEFMENGSLDKYLFDRTQKIEWAKIEWAKLYEIALGTARGIRYLHEECQQKIVHYDIKPANVLLTADFSPKVADFGLAKYRDRGRSYATLTGGGRGTPGYAAPEMWMPMPVTHKCDVYSFGMLLFEILGRTRNLDLSRAEGEQWFPMWVWSKYEQGEMETIMSHCGIEEEDKAKAERMCRVALWCVQKHPEARPSMSRVLRMLEKEEEVALPVSPFKHLMSDDASSSSLTGRTTDSSSEMYAHKNDSTEVESWSSLDPHACMHACSFFGLDIV